MEPGERERLLIAGFGGQGILTLGKLLARTAMLLGRHVTYLPTYGSEVRGGTANCHVVISPRAIFSPVVEHADALVIMNDLSFDRFVPRLKGGGTLVANTSLIPQSRLNGRDDLLVLPVDATAIAAEIGDVVVANMVMMGAYLTARPVVPLEALTNVLRESLSGRKAALLPANEKALDVGARLARKLLGGDAM